MRDPNLRYGNFHPQFFGRKKKEQKIHGMERTDRFVKYFWLYR